MIGTFKWQRVSLLMRLVCGFFGLVGLLLARLLFSDVSALEKLSASNLFHLALGGVGLLIFLLVAIFGQIPNMVANENHGKTKPGE